MSEHNPETHKGPHLTIANATSRNIRIRWPALGKYDCALYIYVYIYICRDKHVNTLAGVSSKHKQTSCWNETNSLSHHLLSLQKAMFQFHYPNDLIHIGQFSKLIDFLHTVYMLHTCCIRVAFCGKQCSLLASGSSEPSNSMALSEDLRLTLVDCVCWDYLQGFCQTHTRRVTAIFNIF